MNRSLWLLMLLLLGISAVGAWAVNHSSGSPGNNTPAPALKDETPPYVAALGHVDIEPRVQDLYPRQAGLVVKVARENEEVKADDVLLQIDDTLARRDVERAKIALRVAENNLRKAQIAAKRFPHQVLEQSAAVTAAEKKYNAAAAEKQVQDKQLKDVFKPTPEKEKAMNETVAFFGAMLDVEKAKLAELKATEPLQQLQIDDATDDVEDKRVLLKKAEDALALYQVRAPSAGMVLLTSTGKGETLGNNPKAPALRFRPAGPLIIRAEVLQEWGQLVRLKQKVAIEDDTYDPRKWEGEVESISNWYAPTRTPIIEPFKMNDVRTLECLIKITSPEDGLRIGQRVRVKIKT